MDDFDELFNQAAGAAGAVPHPTTFTDSELAAIPSPVALVRDDAATTAQSPSAEAAHAALAEEQAAPMQAHEEISHAVRDEVARDPHGSCVRSSFSQPPFSHTHTPTGLGEEGGRGGDGARKPHARDG